MPLLYNFEGRVDYVARALGSNVSNIEKGAKITGLLSFDETVPDGRTQFPDEGQYDDVVLDFQFNIHDFTDPLVILHTITLANVQGTRLSINMSELNYVYYVDLNIVAPSIAPASTLSEFKFRLDFHNATWPKITSVQIAEADVKTYLSKRWSAYFTLPNSGGVNDKMEGFIDP